MSPLDEYIKRHQGVADGDIGATLTERDSSIKLLTMDGMAVHLKDISDHLYNISEHLSNIEMDLRKGRPNDP